MITKAMRIALVIGAPLHHATDIRELKQISEALTKHKTETKVYWRLAGAAITLIAGALIKVVFLVRN